MRKWLLVLSMWCVVCANAQTHIQIDDPETWTISQLAPYIGQTVIFDTPLIVTSNYKYVYVSPRRVFSATNQVEPGSPDYYNMLTLNSQAALPIVNIDEYHRTGEKIYHLEARVASGSLTMLSGEWRGNTREELEAGIPDVDQRGEHTLLVCGANLEYYLVEQFSSPGPRNDAEHQKQRAKVSKALAKINADIYGLVEVQQGDGALKEIAEDLTKNTGRNFSYIPDKSGPNGTYTKSSFVYCSDVVEPIGMIQEIESGVKNRKKMQLFEEKSTGERFLFSINHFKAKSGNGTGADADQGDGQSGYNATRVGEALAILSKYNKLAPQIDEEDILMMGDLNAYAMEDPIRTLIEGGMTDLHRFFHRDSSYSYTYHSEAGYLDHALCSKTLLPQITGMNAYHINSDESDNFTYDKSDDATMFRCSDHDPVLVGLRLDGSKEALVTIGVNSWEVYGSDEGIYVRNAAGIDSPAYYRVYTIDGRLLQQGDVKAEMQDVGRPAQSGVYVVMIYYDGQIYSCKVIVP
ncbi:MAG: endonuclease/exonuclease/phosphatase family protein [Paludibacteraceae bacterium]|nr:endonuclease/exonuclease/phosphatase family protein [Paludibacteraceae bacterium]